jgi:hypothetical protein
MQNEFSSERKIKLKQLKQTATKAVKIKRDLISRSEVRTQCCMRLAFTVQGPPSPHERVAQLISSASEHRRREGGGCSMPFKGCCEVGMCSSSGKILVAVLLLVACSMHMKNV